jgi:hypothetical protein
MPPDTGLAFQKNTWCESKQDLHDFGTNMMMQHQWKQKIACSLYWKIQATLMFQKETSTRAWLQVLQQWKCLDDRRDLPKLAYVLELSVTSSKTIGTTPS